MNHSSAVFHSVKNVLGGNEILQKSQNSCAKLSVAGEKSFKLSCVCMPWNFPGLTIPFNVHSSVSAGHMTGSVCYQFVMNA